VLGTGGGGSTGTVVDLKGVGVAYVNAGHPDAHADTAYRATDGLTATAWMTQTYGDQAFGGLLPGGLGLVLDAGHPVALSSVTVTTPTPGFTAEIRASDSATSGFTPDSSSQTVSGTTASFTLIGTTAQYYAVWITRLPPGGSAQISEVTAKS